MKRYKNPGLPAWPALYFDERRRKAAIRDKVSSWKSNARAGNAWASAVLVFFPLTVWAAFQTAPGDTGEERLKSFLVLVAVLMAIALGFMRLVLLPMFNLHGSRSKVEIIFTPERIRVDGRNVGRLHNGSPLSLTCMIAPDAKAQEKLQLRRYGPEWTHTYQSARCVNLIIRITPGAAMFVGSYAVGPGNTIELAKVLGDEKAHQFSAVCQAALELTAPAGEQRAAAVGVDLDAFV